MAYYAMGGFPPQQLSFNRKNKAWRKRCIDFADNHSLMHYHLARKDVFSMEVNYDLLRGRLHMDDLRMLLNPFNLDASFIPDNVQHYSVINSKLNVLRGEEGDRLFDFRVVVTNPTAISEMEEEKNKQANEMLQQLIADTSKSDEEFNQELEKLSDYFQYEYQDKREVRGNFLVNHYIRELEVEQLFNKGFEDAYTVGEEAYAVDIVGGEPFIEKIDPRKMRVLRSGYSTKIEDADMVILEDYWSPGRVIDTYWDQLGKKDVEKLENLTYDSGNAFVDEMDNIDERRGFVLNPHYPDWTAGDAVFPHFDLFGDPVHSDLLPYDLNGNVRVMRVYWKSRRKIKKVKSYDPETGEEEFNFYPENYHCDPDKGEEEQAFWVNEAWEGTKIGADIYVNMRPRPIQYNRLSNPSRCHFGIIGSIYSTNGDEPYSLVDIAKPYAYLYDIIHDRLNKTLAKNQGKLVRMDFAKVPRGWDVDKWLYYISVNGIVVEDSFKEGETGPAQGKLAGGLNNASTGVVDVSLGTEIQQYITLLEWIKTSIGELMGISRQREGQVSNRETVGGVERATLQSSHITRWIFLTHDSVKRRVLECLLETAKIALRGRKKKFRYILPDGSSQLVEIDGDEFAECDYGIVVDNSQGTQELNQKLDILAQAALQNQILNFSNIMKLYTTKSVAEKQRMIEAYEKRMLEQQQQQQQIQQQQFQQQLEQQAQIAQAQAEQQMQIARENNETKILVAQINSQAEADRLTLMNEETGLTRAEEAAYKREELAEKSKEFDAKLKQDEEKMAFERQKHKDDVRLKEKQIAKSSTKRN